MRRVFTVAVFWGALLCSAPGLSYADSAPPGMATVFLKNTPDIPLMPGFSEIEDESLVFDKPDGKIATSLAVSKPVSVEKVRDFYRQTLPQLGWTEVEKSGNSYIRGGERLRLSIDLRPERTSIRFELAPLTKITPQKPTSP